MRSTAKSGLDFFTVAVMLLIFFAFTASKNLAGSYYGGVSGCALCFLAGHPFQISLLLIMAYSIFKYFHVKIKTTEEKAHNMIAASEDRFRLMIENTPVGVCIIDEYGMFEYVNTAFTELYEYEQDELIGKHITIIILENLYEIAMKNYNDFINGSIPLSREWSAAAKSGKKLTVLVNSTKITDLSGRMKSILFIADITDRQKMQQELINSREILKTARDAAESLNLQKSRFLASVSHDIRTPLNSIIGFSELLEQSELSDAQKEMIRFVKNSGNDLLALINDILDLSKIEAGKFEIENEAFDIKEIFYNAIKSLFPLAQKKALKFSIAIDENINRLVISDAHRYKRVINNLLSNAIKFTESGEIRAELKIIAQCESYYTIQTSITDSGIGIAPDMLKRLFTPFEQCGRSTSQKYGGTGLGLAISSQIIRLIGGDAILVESEIGRGSRFFFNLNLEKADIKTRVLSTVEKNGGMAAVNQSGKAPEIKKLTILAADDNTINIKLIETILKSEGHTVVAAENGREAVDFARNASFDLILMDVNMPELDGYAATAELRRMGVNTPVIAITAAAMQDDLANCIKNGMDDVLTKPIIRDVFIAKINEYAVKIKKGGNIIGQNIKPSFSSYGPANDRVFDRNFLLINTGGKTELACELISIFSATCETEIDQLGNFIKSGEMGSIKLSAHKIKGSALNVGAARLANEAAKLETAAAQKNAGVIDVIYINLKKEYEKLKEEVKLTIKTI